MKELEQISVTTYNITSNAMMTSIYISNPLVHFNTITWESYNRNVPEDFSFFAVIFVGLDSALHTVSLR